MARQPRQSNPDEDPDQSKRFLDLANELEAGGDLSPTEGEAVMERILKGRGGATAKKAAP